MQKDISNLTVKLLQGQNIQWYSSDCIHNYDLPSPSPGRVLLNCSSWMVEEYPLLLLMNHLSAMHKHCKTTTNTFWLSLFQMHIRLILSRILGRMWKNPIEPWWKFAVSQCWGERGSKAWVLCFGREEHTLLEINSLSEGFILGNNLGDCRFWIGFPSAKYDFYLSTFDLVHLDSFTSWIYGPLSDSLHIKSRVVSLPKVVIWQNLRFLGDSLLGQRGSTRCRLSAFLQISALFQF